MSNVEATRTDSEFQRFEFVDEKSSKFWELRVNGTTVDVRFGKIGTVGQTQSKEFDDGTAAQKHADKLTVEKTRKGYLEVGPLKGSPSGSSRGKSETGGLQDLPKEIIAIKKLWADMVLNLRKIDSDEGKELLESYEEVLSVGRFGFDPKVSQLESSEVDRLGNVLRGPIFSCRGYEWPIQSGYPMVPFIQLDLEYCGRIGGVDLGSGLLQAFMGHGKFLARDALIRVIPRTAINEENLLPVPKFGHDIKAFTDISWATQEYDPDDEDCQALQITKFSPRRFGIPTIEKLRGREDMKSLRAMGLTDAQVKEFDVLVGAIAKKFRPSGFHLFGTFSPIQYDVSEKPEVLFCFESEEYGFNFGDGNGQIFYQRLDSGGIVFSFDWSCG